MILDGKLISAGVDLLTKELLDAHKKDRMPKLSVVLIGDNPASLRYIKRKQKKCEEFGIHFELVKLDNHVGFDEIAETIARLNKDSAVDGIILQLPIPEACKYANSLHPKMERELIDMIDPNKDVDGVTHTNIGKYVIGDESAIIPATAAGVMEMLRFTGIDLEGKSAVVIGRSMIVGKPVSMLLLNNNVGVTIVHSHVKNMEQYTKLADIIVVAAGSPGLIQSHMIKEGAIVIDVGISIVDGKLKGDAAFDAMLDKVLYISPVPGGVGPLTVSFVVHNLVKCYLRHEV